MAKDKVVCAVDIGSSKIATVIAALGDEDRIHLIGVSSVPSRGIKKDQVVDIEQAVTAITESIGSCRTNGWVLSVYRFTLQLGVRRLKVLILMQWWRLPSPMGRLLKAMSCE
jgi:hypothetical protein